MTATLQEVLTGLKAVLEPLDVQVYDFIPDAPVAPCVAIYAERWPYVITEDVTIILWCIAGTIETQGAQATLMDWFTDDGPTSIVALLDADSTLGGTVSNVLPVEMRTWSIDPTQDGRARYVQGQIVLNVLR